MLRCFCLVDITHNGSGDLAKKQLKNWHTLLQTLCIRTGVIINNHPICVYRNINGLDFGECFSGFHNVWIVDFELEDYSKISNEIDSLYYLKFDINGVPIIGNLENTAIFDKNCFFDGGKHRNICFLSL
jgi:hypothetical protein